MFVILLALWLVFAGSVTVTNLILGVLVAGLITLLCTKYMGYDTKRFYGKFSKADEIAVYLAYLLKEIVKENFDVLRFIYRKGQPKPMLVRFHGKVQSEPLRVLVANSITLTPGTITVGMDGDQLTVHCLKRSMLDTSPDSVFERWIRRLEA